MASTLLATVVKSAAGPNSTIARATQALPPSVTNVSSAERWLSLAAGGYLTAFGLSGRGPGVLSLVSGGYLLYRAATGNCPAYQVLGVSMSDSIDAMGLESHGTGVVPFIDNITTTLMLGTDRPNVLRQEP